jgi:hypothetical protein
MIKITTSRPVKTLRPGDADFAFSPDGIQLVSRAGFEISNNCPDGYKSILITAINAGWIKPIAHMRDVEYTMELLRK